MPPTVAGPAVAVFLKALAPHCDLRSRFSSATERDRFLYWLYADLRGLGFTPAEFDIVVGFMRALFHARGADLGDAEKRLTHGPDYRAWHDLANDRVPRAIKR